MRTRFSLLAATALVAGIAYLVLREALPWQAVAAVKAVPVTALAIAVAGSAHRWVRWITAGLALSVVGDVALAVPDNAGFVVGLAAFGAAHLCYIAGFVSADRTPRWVRAVPFAAWAVIAGSVVLPGTGSLRVPVALYVVAICTMMWRAAARVVPEAGRSAWLGCAGAVVFGISDTSLATELFVTPYAGSTLLVMVTYWGGQLGIAASAALED